MFDKQKINPQEKSYPISDKLYDSGYIYDTTDIMSNSLIAKFESVHEYITDRGDTRHCVITDDVSYSGFRFKGAW